MTAMKRPMTIALPLFIQCLSVISNPDIRFGWGYAEIVLSTHAIGGLSKNDFIVAAPIDAFAER